MLACAVWSIACAVLRSPSRKSKSSQILRNAYVPASVGEGYDREWWWCGVEMGWKGLLPKAYPQNVWMCKGPVCGRGGIERRCAHRPRELSLSKARPGSRECTLDSRVRRAHRLITLPTASNRIHLVHLHRHCYIARSSGVSCSPRHGQIGINEMECAPREPASICGYSRPSVYLCVCLRPRDLTYNIDVSTRTELSPNSLRITSLVSIAVASFTRSRLCNIRLPKWFPPRGSPSNEKPS